MIGVARIELYDRTTGSIKNGHFSPLVKQTTKLYNTNEQSSISLGRWFVRFLFLSLTLFLPKDTLPITQVFPPLGRARDIALLYISHFT